MNDLIQQYIQQRVYNKDQGWFPAAKPLPTQGPEALDLAMNMAMGATASPIKKSPDARSARILQDILQRQGRLGMEHQRKLLELVRRNLKIPVKTMNRMSDERLVGELLGVLQDRVR